jgi:hypothetical protein
MHTALNDCGTGANPAASANGYVSRHVYPWGDIHEIANFAIMAYRCIQVDDYEITNRYAVCESCTCADNDADTPLDCRLLVPPEGCRRVNEVREAVVFAGKKRVRPAMMTTAVAVIALLPVLSSTGKGADIMVPMAIPAFGGMIIQVMTIFVVPLLQSIWREGAVTRKLREAGNTYKNETDQENETI